MVGRQAAKNAGTGRRGGDVPKYGIIEISGPVRRTQRLQHRSNGHSTRSVEWPYAQLQRRDTNRDRRHVIAIDDEELHGPANAIDVRSSSDAVILVPQGERREDGKSRREAVFSRAQRRRHMFQVRKAFVGPREVLRQPRIFDDDDRRQSSSSRLMEWAAR